MEEINNFKYDSSTNTISGFYNDNIDIYKLDKIVIAALQHRLKKQEFSLKETASKAGRMLNTENITWEDSLNLFGDTARILLSNNMFSEQEYSETTSSIVSKIYSSKGKPKLHHLYIYIRRLRKYININILLHQEVDISLCQSCGKPLPEIQAYNQIICDYCGVITSRFVKILGNLDTDSTIADKLINNNIKNTASLKSTARVLFEKKIYRHQCRYQPVPPKHIVNIIKEYIGSMYTNILLIPSKHISNIKLMRKSLMARNLSVYKDDINYFCNVIWNFPTHNLIDKDEQIFKDFDEIQPVIESILSENTEKKDSSIINAWRIWRHYIQADVFIDPEEFDIPKTTSIVHNYESIWRKSCNILGWDIKYTLINKLGTWEACEYDGE